MDLFSTTPKQLTDLRIELVSLPYLFDEGMFKEFWESLQQVDPLLESAAETIRALLHENDKLETRIKVLEAQSESA